MSRLFGFLQDMGNYEQRKLARYDSEDGKVMVSTAAVSDSNQPYETAITHPEFNDGKIIIVSQYSTKEEALVGHDVVLKMICSDELPCEIVDISEAGVAKLCDVASEALEKTGNWRVCPRRKPVVRPT